MTTAAMPELPGHKKSRPWWASAILGGVSCAVVVLSILSATGVTHAEASPKLAQTAIVAAPVAPPAPVLAAPVMATPITSESLSIEEWRQLQVDIRELRGKLETTNSEMGKLNTRLSLIEHGVKVTP